MKRAIDEEVDWNRLVIAKCSLKNVGLQQNGGVGVLSAQEAHVVLTATTCTQNGGDAYQV